MLQYVTMCLAASCTVCCCVLQCVAVETRFGAITTVRVLAEHRRLSFSLTHTKSRLLGVSVSEFHELSKFSKFHELNESSTKHKNTLVDIQERGVLRRAAACRSVLQRVAVR